MHEWATSYNGVEPCLVDGIVQCFFHARNVHYTDKGTGLLGHRLEAFQKGSKGFQRSVALAAKYRIRPESQPGGVAPSVVYHAAVKQVPFGEVKENEGEVKDEDVAMAAEGVVEIDSGETGLSLLYQGIAPGESEGGGHCWCWESASETETEG